MSSNSFLTRSLTAIIFAIVVLFLILFNIDTIFIFLSLVAFFCAFEYITIRQKAHSPLIAIILAIICGPALIALTHWGDFYIPDIRPFIILSAIYFLYLGARLFIPLQYASTPVAILSSTFLYIGLPLLMLFIMSPRDIHTYFILFIIVSVWANDTFAYFIGSSFGRTAVAPKISPNKTVEGTIGGIIATILVACLMYYIFEPFPLLHCIALALIISIFGFIGDLVESHLKRTHNLKDSGNLLPGHGGFLDRFDSFIFVIPFVLLYLNIFALH